MVKGISKQVIVVDAPEPEIFEQAIFILKERVPSVTDEMLLKEAKRLSTNPAMAVKWYTGPVWAICGGTVVAVMWILSALL